jgi:hypothetical protein
MASYESSSSAPLPRSPQWQQEYESALRETDHTALFKRIEVAEAAILSRRETLECSPDGFAERREIDNALTKVGSMKKEILHFL